MISFQKCQTKEKCRTSYEKKCEKIPKQKCRNFKNCVKKPVERCKNTYLNKCRDVSG